MMIATRLILCWRSRLSLSHNDDAESNTSSPLSHSAHNVRLHCRRSSHLHMNFGVSFKLDTQCYTKRSLELPKLIVYLKLEEKQQAKEAEMNEIQAKTQEETETQIKQLRRSLYFKAIPMPFVYMKLHQVKG
ncbi:putative protein WVD2-like/6 [Dioscorea sansibarensis]